jgi:hypothetical protein
MQTEFRPLLRYHTPRPSGSGFRQNDEHNMCTRNEHVAQDDNGGRTQDAQDDKAWVRKACKAYIPTVIKEPPTTASRTRSRARHSAVAALLPCEPNVSECEQEGKAI